MNLYERVAWSAEDDEFLIANYATTNTRTLSKQLHRSIDSITSRAKKLGLLKANEVKRQEAAKRKEARKVTGWQQYENEINEVAALQDALRASEMLCDGLSHCTLPDGIKSLLANAEKANMTANNSRIKRYRGIKAVMD